MGFHTPTCGFRVVGIPQGWEGTLLRFGTEPRAWQQWGAVTPPWFGVRGHQGLRAWEERGLDPRARLSSAVWSQSA